MSGAAVVLAIVQEHEHEKMPRITPPTAKAVARSNKILHTLLREGTSNSAEWSLADRWLARKVTRIHLLLCVAFFVRAGKYSTVASIQQGCPTPVLVSEWLMSNKRLKRLTDVSHIRS